MPLDIRYLVGAKQQKLLRGLPFAPMKEAVLGKRYTLSLALIGEQRARTLNYTYRSKDSVPNVLSFPLGEREGEIIIVPRQAAKEAVKLGMSTRNYVGYLFIHGMLHLKGFRHGKKMEQKEDDLTRRFQLR